MSNGKGSNRRPLSVSKEEFDKRWIETFGRQPTDSEKDDNDKFYSSLEDGSHPVLQAIAKIFHGP